MIKYSLDKMELTKRRFAGAAMLCSISEKPLLVAAAAAFLTVATTGGANAFQVYSNNGLVINLDTTLEYSNDYRLNNPSDTILNNTNGNDGDQNFQHGFTSNQFEAVPIFNLTYGNFGVHISGEAYLDTEYLQKNQNNSANTVNSFVTNNQHFSRATVNLDGRNAELLDAFAYDSFDFGADDSQSVTLKVGRQTLLWGQSLFFPNNGIAAGQAPLDINKAESLANPQAQQIFLPVGQAVFTYQPNDWISFQGYYQFEWRSSQFPGVGSYFSDADFFAQGGDSLIVGQTPFGPSYFSRAHDGTPPSQNGQFGFSTQLQLGPYAVGFYGLRFDAKTPQEYVHPFFAPPVFTPHGVAVGSYNVVYNRDIQLYGASVTRNLGPVNVGAEISGRIHQDLFSNGITVIPGTPAAAYNENSNPGYAVGDTLHAQASAIWLTPAIPFDPGGASVAGEVEANRVLSVTANKSALIPGRTSTAVGLEAQFTPTYYNVLPNLNVNIPVGVTWYPYGDSEIDPTMNAGTGVFDIGVSATYKTVWTAGLNYQDYLGSTAITTSMLSKQPLADRGFISFQIDRTF